MRSTVGITEVTVDELDRQFVELDIRLHLVPWENRVAFCLVGRPINSQERAMVTDLQFENIKEGQELRPTFKLRKDQLQSLMDELYRVGVRPTEHGTAGELAATKAHLRDMRVLVAQVLGTPELVSR